MCVDWPRAFDEYWTEIAQEVRAAMAVGEEEDA
jgi:hypothetical protein